MKEEIRRGKVKNEDIEVLVRSARAAERAPLSGFGGKRQKRLVTT